MSASPSLDHLSARDRQARDVGLDVLAATDRIAGGVKVPEHQGDASTAILFAGVMRGRRLTAGAFHLADLDLALEAMILARTLFEYLVTMSWLVNDDDGVRFGDWQADDLRRRVWLDDQHGLMDPPTRAATQARLDDLRAQLGRHENLPSLETMASDVGLDKYGYNLAYRYDSATAAHPRYSALELFLRPNPEVPYLVAPTPAERSTPSPYATCAAILLDLILLLNHRLADPIAEDSLLRELQARVFALARTEE